MRTDRRGTYKWHLTLIGSVVLDPSWRGPIFPRASADLRIAWVLQQLNLCAILIANGTALSTGFKETWMTDCSRSEKKNNRMCVHVCVGGIISTCDDRLIPVPSYYIPIHFFQLIHGCLAFLEDNTLLVLKQSLYLIWIACGFHQTKY